MASTEQTINFIIYIISVYIGYFIIISGLIGNILNILVFTQLKLFRRNQSASYLIAASILDCCQLIFTTSSRVTTTTFNFDLTRTSIIWCKLRVYLLQFGSTTSVVIVCFAAIDQYLSTNVYSRLREISTFKLFQRLIAILIIFTIIYCIPVLISQEIRPNSGCGTYNPSFNYFYSFVHFCFVIGILPIVVSTLFSLLAYQNVRRIIRRQIPIVRRRLDHQLTAMILVRVALFVITTSPYVCLQIYQMNSSVNQNNNNLIEQLIKTVLTAIFNINYAVFDFLILKFEILLFFLEQFLCFFGIIKSISSTSEIFLFQKDLA
jgi:hypothetical protein